MFQKYGNIFLKNFIIVLYTTNMVPMMCRNKSDHYVLKYLKKYGNISVIFDEIFQNKNTGIFHITTWLCNRVPRKYTRLHFHSR